MSAKVVILGASGFVGSELMRCFQRDGTVPVVGLGSSAVDLITDEGEGKLATLLNSKTIVIVALRAHKAGDEFASFERDVAMASRVGRCLASRPVQRCVYLSSVAVYGDHTTNLAIREDAPINPASLYGISKFAGECAVRHAAKKAGVPLTILRPCMVYGPGDSSDAYGVGRFLRSALVENQVKLYGDGTELRDYVFVRDLAEIILQLALSDGEGVYNVGSGQSRSFRDIVQSLQKLMGRKLSVIELPRTRPKTDQRIDVSKLLAALPGMTFTDFERGLEESLTTFAAGASARTRSHG